MILERKHDSSCDVDAARAGGAIDTTRANRVAAISGMCHRVGDAGVLVKLDPAK